jgi:hypothetical protein
MHLVNHSPGPNTFSYLVPSIPGSTITVAAVEGYDDVYGPYAVAHADGLSATSKPALKIPTPCTLATPSTDTTGVTSTTKFSFQSPATNPGPFVVKFWNDDLTGVYQYLWVVTPEKQLTIPEVVGGAFKLQPGKVHAWNVQTHGTFASVDAMAGPKGFLDPIGAETEPVGPNAADGVYTLSASRAFTTAP